MGRAIGVVQHAEANIIRRSVNHEAIRCRRNRKNRVLEVGNNNYSSGGHQRQGEPIPEASSGGTNGEKVKPGEAKNERKLDLLRTARVRLMTREGLSRVLRAVCDTGAQVNLITTKCVKACLIKLVT